MHAFGFLENKLFKKLETSFVENWMLQNETNFLGVCAFCDPSVKVFAVHVFVVCFGETYNS